MVLAALLLVTACRETPRSAPAPVEEAAPAPAPAAGAAPEPEARWDPWADAASRGIDFRAVGNEPGWYLELDDERSMRLLYAYGEMQATVPAPQPRVTATVTTLESSGDGHVMKVEITAGPCSDGMSDQSYPLNVSVDIDGTALRGCGRWLTTPPSSL